MTALFTTGFTHDRLLEAGVFLVSVKMMLMGYSLSVANEAVKRQLDANELAIAQIPRVLSREGDLLTERSDGTDAIVRHSAPVVG